MLTATDHTADRQALVIGTCENGKELVSLANKQAPDVVIADIDMPDLNGIDAAAQHGA